MSLARSATPVPPLSSPLPAVLTLPSPQQEGKVYAVEFSHRPGRDLINVAKKRTNIIPIIEDARHPLKYRMLVPMVDVVFADVDRSGKACCGRRSLALKGGRSWENFIGIGRRGGTKI